MCVTQEREVQAGGEKGFFVCLFFVQSLAGAMVARLPTEQEAVGSSPTSGLSFSLERTHVHDERVSGSSPVCLGPRGSGQIAERVSQAARVSGFRM